MVKHDGRSIPVETNGLTKTRVSPTDDTDVSDVRRPAVVRRTRIGPAGPAFSGTVRVIYDNRTHRGRAI